jgi:DNA-directed RNA polymerase subunit alpha
MQIDEAARITEEKLALGVAELGLSVRTTNCLEENGIHTVSALLKTHAETLLSFDNFGEKTLEEVYKSLERLGFYRRVNKNTDVQNGPS